MNKEYKPILKKDWPKLKEGTEIMVRYGDVDRIKQETGKFVASFWGDFYFEKDDGTRVSIMTGNIRKIRVKRGR